MIKWIKNAYFMARNRHYMQRILELKQAWLRNELTLPRYNVLVDNYRKKIMDNIEKIKL